MQRAILFFTIILFLKCDSLLVIGQEPDKKLTEYELGATVVIPALIQPIIEVHSKNYLGRQFPRMVTPIMGYDFKNEFQLNESRDFLSYHSRSIIFPPDKMFINRAIQFTPSGLDLVNFKKYELRKSNFRYDPFLEENWSRFNSGEYILRKLLYDIHFLVNGNCR